MNGDNEIIDSITKLLGSDIFEENTFLLKYGKNELKSDIDLCLLIPDAQSVNNFTFGKLDLLVINMSLCLDLIVKLDPIVTEPLLTGNLIMGNENDFLSIKQKLIDTKPNDEAVRHLVLRTFETLLSAETFFNYYLNDNNLENLKKSFNNLAFSISYASFAKHYNSKERISTLDELINEQLIELPDFWKYRNRIKDKNDNLIKSDMILWLKKWRNKLMNISN